MKSSAASAQSTEDGIKLFCNLTSNLQGLGRLHRTAREPFGQRLALDKLNDEEMFLFKFL